MAAKVVYCCIFALDSWMGDIWKTHRSLLYKLHWTSNSLPSVSLLDNSAPVSDLIATVTLRLTGFTFSISVSSVVILLHRRKKEYYWIDRDGSKHSLSEFIYTIFIHVL